MVFFFCICFRSFVCAGKLFTISRGYFQRRHPQAYYTARAQRSILGRLINNYNYFRVFF